MRTTKRTKFPWLPLVLFLGTLFLFWVHATLIGVSPVGYQRQMQAL